jgi:hypothetical protein
MLFHKNKLIYGEVYEFIMKIRWFFYEFLIILCNVCTIQINVIFGANF